MKVKENIILVDYDCPDHWEFVDGLSESTNEVWKIKKLISNMNHSGRVQNFFRYFKYFWLPLITFFKRDRYRRVIGWQQFFGLIFGFYCHLFHVKKAPDVYIMTFIYNQKTSVLGKIYEKFIKYCITSDVVKKIIVFSKSEPEYYSKIFGIERSLFFSSNLGIENISCKYPITDNGRYLSAGRSNRDYEFLTNSWDDSWGDIDIICDTLAAEEKDNLKIFTSVHNDEFFKMLSACHAVIISLSDENVSSGQLVILQAMMMKKPVICTKNDTVTDYIDSGTDGIIIEKNKNSLLFALQYVEEHYEELSVKARYKFDTKFTEYQMGINIGKIIKKASQNTF